MSPRQSNTGRNKKLNKKRKEATFGHVTKKLQTELQVTIAFSCYDSDKNFKAGKSANIDPIGNILAKSCFPSVIEDDEQMNCVDLFLSDSECFKPFLIVSTR